MSKLLEGIVDVLLPGLISGGANATGNPFEAPWGNNTDGPEPVTDADGTRGDEAPPKPPLWWGNYPFPPGSSWGPVVPGGQGTMLPPTEAGLAPEPIEQKEPTVVQPAPDFWSAGNRAKQEAIDRAKAIKRGQQRQHQIDMDATENREWTRNRDREQAAESEMERKENDFLKRRRDNEQKWQQQQQPAAPVPRGVLLPVAGDWTADLDEDPNETNAERDSRRQRAEWTRRGRNAAIVGIGGVSAGAIASTWKERAKWAAKNSGTTQQRQFPGPVNSIPNSGKPADLDPHQTDPSLPVFPSKPVPRSPVDRTSSCWIRPVAHTERVIATQSETHHVSMDCTC